MAEDPTGETIPPAVHPLTERLEQLAKLKEEALHAGSEAAVQRQHQKGKLTARERIDLLLDPGSFVELDMLARHRAHGFGIENNRPLTDGVVTEVGGVLSHAAIVARERRIPAVLSVAAVTARMPEGAMITIDGAAGTVIMRP